MCPPSGDTGLFVSQADVDAAVTAATAAPGGCGHMVLVASCLDGSVQLLRLLAGSPAFKGGRCVWGLPVFAREGGPALKETRDRRARACSHIPEPHNPLISSAPLVSLP